MSEDVRRLVGRNVRRLRIAAGLTQAQLAERMGVDRAYVSGLEKGERNPTIVTLVRSATCRFLGNVTLVYPGMTAWEDITRVNEGADEAVRQERERDEETARRFIRTSAWWLTHSSGTPVRAPGHADRLYMSQHGWTVEFGANSFLVGKAIERRRKVLERCRNEAEAGQVVSRSQIEAELKKVISGCVANSNGQEYNGYYR